MKKTKKRQTYDIISLKYGKVDGESKIVEAIGDGKIIPLEDVNESLFKCASLIVGNVKVAVFEQAFPNVTTYNTLPGHLGIDAGVSTGDLIWAANNFFCLFGYNADVTAMGMYCAFIKTLNEISKKKINAGLIITAGAVFGLQPYCSESNKEKLAQRVEVVSTIFKKFEGSLPRSLEAEVSTIFTHVSDCKYIEERIEAVRKFMN